MDNQTVFFILGPCLVAVAVIVSFVGLRFDKFPGSRLLLVGATVGVAVLVVATMTFAWRNASDEQTKRDAELASNVAQNEQSGNTTEADEEAGSQAPAEAAQGGDTTASTTTGSSTTGSSTTAASTAAGKQVFATAGCTGCHRLSDAGSTATTGPDLDQALNGKPESFIRMSIIDPNAFIEKGYPPNVMPQGYEDQLSPDDLDALVAYLSQVTGG